MKRPAFLYVVVLFQILTSCSNPANITREEKEPTTDTAFYPISSFIHGQLIYIDSVPLAVIRYSSVNHVTDTSVVEKENFKKIATALTTPDISLLPLKAQYEETSFIDATLGTISLTYTAKNDNSTIKRADVLLNHENGKVKSIYIEKNLSAPDSSVVQKILWAADRSCQITTLTQKANQPEHIVIDRYVWDNRE